MKIKGLNRMPNTDYSHTTRAKRLAGKQNAVFKSLNPYSAQGDPTSIKLGATLGGCCNTVTVPDAPTSVSATAGNRQAIISFSVPADGGSPIVSYTVTSSPGGITATGSSSPITITGLTNGTSYTFTVVATNSVGDSVESSASPPVTPVTVPDAPTSVSATPGNGQATVSFTAPANGGSPITSYTVRSSPGGFTATGSSSPITITGLTNGTSYTFTVVATNSIGNSVASSASTSVKPATVPNAPTAVSAVPLHQKAIISFTAPANGGSPITSYTVTSSPDGITATGSSSPITVTGLVNGTGYTFTVVATNNMGDSVASSASSSVTPLPLEVFTSGSGSWTAPSGVTSVTYLVVGGGGGGGSGGGTGAAGGGGGGSVKTGTLSVTPGVTYNYTIGNGGVGGTDAGPGIDGESSVFATITANGGGFGYGNYGVNGTGNYGAGGSAQSGDTPTTGGSGGKVRDGSVFPNPVGTNTGAGGGGGGAGGAGVTSITSGGNVTYGGAGGTGIISNLRNGTNVTYGSGGRGGDENTTIVGTNGAANTGNGGGGASASILGGAAVAGGTGGSGIVVFTFTV